jgi:hypothetical protein
MDEISNSGRDVYDHIHRCAVDESGELVPLVDFDFTSLDPQNIDTIPVAEASSALARVLGWITGNDRNFTNSGGRASALSLLLGNNHRHKSLADIAREANVSRAIVSRWLLGLRDEFQIGLSLRGSLIRDNCRQAQRAAIAAGRHSSVSRKDGTLPSQLNHDEMNPPKTLDQARGQIAELERQ